MSEYGPIVELLEPFLQKIKPSGRTNIMALCPLPGHSDRKPSFAINIENGLWICHSCGRAGGLPKLLRVLGVSTKTADSILGPIRRDLRKRNRREKRKRRDRLRTNPLLGERLLPEELLGVYNWKPLDLIDAGFEPGILREFDIGYDFSNERITFPIRDTYGNLIGISGRAAEDGVLPRYKVYSGGSKVDGEWLAGDFGPEFDEQFKSYGLKSHHHLWNGHRVYANTVLLGKSTPLIVVEGFKSCMWLIQHGWKNTVALMGSSISLQQKDLLCLIATGSVVLFLDNDPAGYRATIKEGKRLSRFLNVEVCSYYPSWATEPDDLNMTGLTKAIEAKERYVSWRTRQENLHAVLDVL